MTELNRFDEWMSIKALEWEAKCTRCGACCGALDDPCENLCQDSKGKFYCMVYERRLGRWHTVSGKELNCVPVREKIAQGHSWPGDEHCGYKQKV